MSEAELTVLVVDVDGRTQCESWTRTAADDGMDGLRHVLGGAVECVTLIEGVLEMWVLGDGIYLCSTNPFASAISAELAGTRQPYYGRAVFAGARGTGSLRSISDDTAAVLTAMVTRLSNRPRNLRALRAVGKVFQDAHM
ncbi:DUF3846 domain-containing protein [Kribbella sp. NPDC059898]|uniref:DUF3846 domain-containing protein n=1 Tax=Kribbella sp. NPDC059898 TaxID=3346995 RepID=UPI003653664C